MIQETPDQAVKRFAATVESALQLAVTEALQEHKRAGHSIAAWQEGRVVTIPADQIPGAEPRDGADESKPASSK